MILAQFSDPHITTAGKKLFDAVDTVASFRRCVQHLLAGPMRPDVLIISGDLVDSGSAEQYRVLRDLLAPLAMPCYLIPGNHDQRSVLRAEFPDHRYLPAGSERIDYVIDVHPLRIIALDTVIPGKPGGELPADSIAWLNDTLEAAPAHPTVIMMHHPPFKTGIAHMDEMGLVNPEALQRIVSRHPQVERILCGHLHRPIQTRFAGTLASTCPSTAHQIALDLSARGAPRFVIEPPGYQLHLWSAEAGLRSHTAAVGEFAGPYPF